MKKFERVLPNEETALFLLFFPLAASRQIQAGNIYTMATAKKDTKKTMKKAAGDPIMEWLEKNPRLHVENDIVVTEEAGKKAVKAKADKPAKVTKTKAAKAEAKTPAAEVEAPADVEKGKTATVKKTVKKAVKAVKKAAAEVTEAVVEAAEEKKPAKKTKAKT